MNGVPKGTGTPMQRAKIASPRKLPYGRHLIDDDDIAAVTDVLSGDWLTTGPAVAAFEAALARQLEAEFVISCNSGTAALHMACAAREIGPGDKVVVPAVTFLATANAVRYMGADVIFADCDPTSGLMRPEDFEEALLRAGDGVKAVLPVHMAGQCADPEAIAEIAMARGIRVIEDACHALGTRYRTGDGDTVAVGSCRHSDMAAFSFHPVKTIAMGEGGAVATNDPELAARLAAFRNHGMTRDAGRFQHPELALDSNGEPNPWYYEMPALGFNYRAPDINCALGLSQLGKLDRFIARRRQLAECYDALLRPLGNMIRPIRRVETSVPAWHLYPVLIDFEQLPVDRAALMRRLSARGVGTQVHYLPVHLQPYYRSRYGDKILAGAESYYAQTLSLPLFPAMADDDVDRVVEELTAAIGD